jgi:hypothetical protein
MKDHRHSALCPMCGGTLTDDSESALVKKVQRHAHDEHDMDMTEEKARSLFQEPEDK